MENVDEGGYPAGPPHTLARLVRLLIGFLVLAAPLVLLVWHELNELLVGRVHPVPLAVATVLLGILIALATALGRQLRGLHGDL